MSALRNLGQKLAHLQDSELENNRSVDQARSRLLEAQRKPSYRFPLVAGLAGASALAAVAVFYISTTPANIIAQLEGEQIVSGAWISAASQQSKVGFSDGSRFSLDEGTARVVDLEPHGAHLMLEQGQARVDIVPNPQSSWRLDAGPFAISVLGTQFTMAWFPDRQSFSIKLLQGSLLIEGPLLGRGHQLQAGQAIQVDLLSAQMRVIPIDQTSARAPLNADNAKGGGAAKQPSEKISAQQQTKNVSRLVRDKLPPPAKTKIAQATPPQLDVWTWPQDIAAGQYQKAIEQVRKLGLQKALARASAVELLGLGDACRLSGEFELATQVYGVIRERFAGDRAGTIAAFHLGRVAFDVHRDFHQAARWLATCVEEEPAEELRMAALGRLIESLQKLGSDNGALQRAKDYLKDYPDGPHADFATQIVQRANSR